MTLLRIGDEDAPELSPQKLSFGSDTTREALRTDLIGECVRAGLPSDDIAVMRQLTDSARPRRQLLRIPRVVSGRRQIVLSRALAAASGRQFPVIPRQRDSVRFPESRLLSERFSARLARGCRGSSAGNSRATRCQ